MSSISGIDGASGGRPLPPGTAPAPANTSPELAKLEVQLSDWVHCPSARTPEGKAHIAEITQQIDAIKAQAKHVEDKRAAPADSTQPARAPGLRLDGLGALLDVRA